MRKAAWLLLPALLTGGTAASGISKPAPATRAAARSSDQSQRRFASPVLKYLAPLAGGMWVSRSLLPSGEPATRLTYMWEREGQVLRAEGWVDGAPSVSIVGWDPITRKTYHLHRRGAAVVSFGYASLDGDEVVTTYRNLIDGGRWRSRVRLVDRDSYRAVLLRVGEGAQQAPVETSLARSAGMLIQETPRAAEAIKPEELHPILARLELLIGGTWQSDAKDPGGKPLVELTYRWGPGRKTILGTGTRDGAKVESVVGWDPKEEKLYYLDRHGSETVYFGHYTVHDEDLTIDFRSLVGRPGQFRTNAWFPDTDTFMAIVRPVKNGRVGEGHKMRWVRVK